MNSNSLSYRSNPSLVLCLARLLASFMESVTRRRMKESRGEMVLTHKGPAFAPQWVQDLYVDIVLLLKCGRLCEVMTLVSILDRHLHKQYICDDVQEGELWNRRDNISCCNQSKWNLKVFVRVVGSCLSTAANESTVTLEIGYIPWMNSGV